MFCHFTLDFLHIVVHILTNSTHFCAYFASKLRY